MTKTYKLIKEHNILECETLSIEYAKIIEQQERKEKYGDIKEDKIYPEVSEVVLDIEKLGGIVLFNPTQVEMEEDVFIDATLVQFKDDFEIVVLIEFYEFREIYYEYLGVKE